ncbi:hypothetical protein [Streptomyces sp. JJ38]|uniref:hypothetical protein n=1 Tax=Streptomyces sp. JJ38 TaxID=2738128 RepID=UPI001C56CE2A|nr:hypothetical protein [Streptomyces sp. JJ38]MBW1600276.1 hypothetical protein [Streptomyces sp. JJ38]
MRHTRNRTRRTAAALALAVTAALTAAGCGDDSSAQNSSDSVKVSEQSEQPKQPDEGAQGDDKGEDGPSDTGKDGLQGPDGETPKGPKKEDKPFKPSGDSPFEKRADALEHFWPNVEQAGQAEGLQPVPAAKKAKDSKVLTVTVGYGACDADHGVHVAQSENLVILGGWREEGTADACTEQLLTDTVKITLDAPLGGRAVVDAATGETLVNATLTLE